MLHSSVIHPGQEIRIPTKKKIERELPSLTEAEKMVVEELLSAIAKSDVIEVRLIGALWKWQFSQQDELHSMMPVRADLENNLLLNTQALVEIADRNYKSAVIKLIFALEIDPECPITIGNLALAHYLDENYSEASIYLDQFLVIAEELGLDTEVHRTIAKELQRKIR